MEGLCGNFNGKSNDDFTNYKDSLIASTAQEFGHIWKLHDCPDIDTEEFKDFDPCKVTIILIIIL